MGYGRYIGYVGALAVALGVGSAVATTPGIAYALPAESSSESPSTGESSSAAESSPEPSTTSTSASSETTDGVAVPPGELRGDDLSPSDSATASSEIVSGGDDAPVVVLSSSGGAHTSTSDARDAEELGIAADLPASGKGDANVLPVQIAAAEPPSQDVAAGPDESTRLARSTGEHTPVQKVAARDTDQSVVAAAEHASPTIGQRVSTLSLAAPIDGPAYSLVAPPTAVVPAPPPTLDEILEEPHTFLVSALAHAVDAVLEVFLAPFGSGSPLQSPMLWTVLAFVRDEFERYFNPHATSSQTTSAVDQGPNLLVNPGAEVGDPSLSGYAAVTIPGWTLTGTPTVIKYGTARRFPVPTSTPGPVLPSILAFPSSDGPIPAAPGGQQFFGGGPVADSTLTQTVKLDAAQTLIDAGGGTYTLSGDLGGFLIDPSRSTVTVNFLDEDEATLGTGTLRSVTAWDRWFSTGFIHRAIAGSIPVNTRSAQVVVTFDDRNPVLGNYNNAYADNLSFTVNDPDLAPAILAPPEANVGQLDHVFMVYLENKGVGQIVGSPNAPFINQLIENYGYASNYYGVTHPSDPNYYPIIGGSDFGFNYNCPSNCFPADTPNLADSIEAADKTWAGYMEGGGGYSTPTDRLPFLAFTDIYDDPERVAKHLFDISQLEQDLADPDTAPDFVWFAADDETNMEGPTDFPVGIFHWALGFLSPAHQYNVKAGDEWLQDQMSTIVESATWQDPSERSVVFVTFDEDYNNITTGVGNEGNHIVTVVVPSPGAVAAGMVEGAFVADDHYNHYSLQRTIEESLDLSPLTNNDKYANPMNEFWELLPPLV
jgi:hypothetical protein